MSSLEEEMQSISKLFCDAESVLSSKGVKQMISELPVLSTKSLSRKQVNTPSPQESPLRPDCEGVNLNPVSDSYKLTNAHIHQSDQCPNITDLTNYVLRDLNINGLHNVDEQCSVSAENAGSQDVLMVRDEPESAICKINSSLYGDSTNIPVPDTLPCSASSETPLSNSKIKNPEQLSSVDFEEIFAADAINQENIDEIIEINSCGPLTSWLDSNNEELPLQNFNVSPKSDINTQKVTCSVKEVSVTKKIQEKTADYCKSEKGTIKTEDETLTEEKKTVRCYRPSKNHRQQTTEKSKLNMAPDFVQPGTFSDRGTSSIAPESDGLFASWCGKSDALSLSPADAENACKEECQDDDLYELFRDVTSDSPEYQRTPTAPSAFPAQPVMQVGESSKQEDPIQPLKKQDEKLFYLIEGTTLKKVERTDLEVDSCSITENQDEMFPDSNAEIIAAGNSFKNIEVSPRNCSSVETSNMLLTKTSPGTTSRDQIKGKVVKKQRKKQSGRKERNGESITSVESELVSNTTAEPKISNKAFLGFSDLSSFQGAKCSLPSKVYALKKQSRKRGKQTKEDKETPSDVSAEIDKAIAGVQMSPSYEPSCLDDILKALN